MKNDDELLPVDPASLAAFESAEAEIVDLTVKGALEQANLPAEIEAEMTRKFTEGLRMTSEMLRSIMMVGGTDLLRDQLDWADRRLPHEGITPEMMKRNLLIYREAVERILEPSHSAAIVPYVDYLVREQTRMHQS